MTTYLHKFRCQNCRLHFIICSWYKEIKPVCCPECGQKEDFLHWVEELDQPICEIVPGEFAPEDLAK